LHLTARGGHIGVTKYLINLGLDVNAKDKRGESTLYYTASGGSLEVMERILQSDPVIYTNPGSWSPLHWAARSGNLQLFKLLREVGMTESTCHTAEPLCSWTSLKVAIFHQNTSLAAYIITLVDDIIHEHPKVTAKGEQPLTDHLPSTRTRELLPPIESYKHGSYWCDGCFNVSLFR
jgi:ankyrin repeat protein